MQRRSWKRATAVLAGLAIMGAGSIALAPSASAAPVAATVDSPGDPAIILRGANQAADPLTVTLTAAAAINDTVTLRVAPQGSDCTTAEDALAGVAWAIAPTETNASVTVGAPTDACAGGTVNNEITLTFTAAVPDNTVIELTNVRYNVGAETPSGPVRIGVNGAAPSAVGSNATVAVVDRIAGATRFSTAAAMAPLASGHADGCADTVVVASGRNFPDALAAAALGFPILLTEPGSLSSEVTGALAAMGTKNVIVVGGTEAVSSAVFLGIEALNETLCDDVADGTINVDRLAGANRYDTARVIADQIPTAGTLDPGLDGCTGPVPTAILASGENFPDALAAGVLASTGSNSCGTGRIPVILTPPNQLRTEAQEALSLVGAQQVIIIGGPVAISDAVQTTVDGLNGGAMSVLRISGATRYLTAIELAKELRTAELGFDDQFLVASGVNFPDALVGGPLGGLLNAPILLSETATLNAAAATLIEDSTNVLDATLLGGTVALSDAVFNGVGLAFLARN
jgi:putative cell wall-binding protein